MSKSLPSKSLPSNSSDSGGRFAQIEDLIGHKIIIFLTLCGKLLKITCNSLSENEFSLIDEFSNMQTTLCGKLLKITGNF